MLASGLANGGSAGAVFTWQGCVGVAEVGGFV